MPEQSLAVNWAEEVDAKGRRFYCDHNSQTTQRERPVPYEVLFPPGVSAQHRRAVQQVEQVTQSRASQNVVYCEWTPRVTFWIAAAMALPVWIFSVSAATDDKWFDSVSLSAFDEDIIDQCAYEGTRAATDDFCDRYFPFMTMQLVATILASIALAMLSMALFLPESDYRCRSTKPLGFGGGYAVAGSALFQLVAIILIVSITHTDTAYVSEDTDAYNDVGTTFWVALVGSVLAVFDAILLLAFIGSAGDGIFYQWTNKTMTPIR